MMISCRLADHRMVQQIMSELLLFLYTLILFCHWPHFDGAKQIHCCVPTNGDWLLKFINIKVIVKI